MPSETEVFEFLENLRQNGAINMLGSVPHIMKEFGLTSDVARSFLVKWMDSLSEQK